MKGGMAASTASGVSVMLETLDLLHAALFNSPNVLGTTDSRPRHIGSESTAAEIATRVMPLLIAKQEEFDRTSHTIYGQPLQGLIDVVNTIATCPKAIATISTSVESFSGDDNAIHDLEDGPERFRQGNCLEGPYAGDAQHLSRACHSANGGTFWVEEASPILRPPK